MRLKNAKMYSGDMASISKTGCLRDIQSIAVSNGAIYIDQELLMGCESALIHARAEILPWSNQDSIILGANALT